MTISFITSLGTLVANISEIQWENLKAFGEYLFWWRSSSDAYKVLNNNIELEIKDTKGKTAFFRKRKHVRFLQDNITTFLDTAWGDGNIFVDYKCSPGKAVDFYEDGYRHRVLILLRETKRRNEEEVFDIQRTIKDGYLDKECYLQTDITYQTKSLEMSVTFPIERFPKFACIKEKNTENTITLGASCNKFLPDGRLQISWKKKNPRLHESYILSWVW